MTPNSPEFAAMIANIQQRLPQQFQALLQAPWMGQQGIVGAPQSSIDASPVPKVHPAHPMRPYPVAQQAPHMGGGYGMPQFSSFMPNRTSGY
jgi:hypothetical protein